MNSALLAGLLSVWTTLTPASSSELQLAVHDISALCQTRITNEVVRISSRTIGLSNHNPMNIKGKGWDGQIGNDRFGHAQFASPDYGLRAGARALVNMQRMRGCKTIRQLIHRYCEANREPYIRALSRAMGIGPDEEFNVYDHLAVMMKTIVKQENGYNPYPDSYFIPYTFIADMQPLK